jgi:hypothetical protein
MNARIKELATEVNAVFDVNAMGRHDGVLFTESELERFAQLIIKEVISEFYDEIQYNFSSGYAKEITDDVKQRFGVE